MSSSLSNMMRSNEPKVLKFEPIDGLLQIPSTGTSFGINLISKYGIKRKVPIGLGPNPNQFYALFGEDDVDFEISFGGGIFKDEDYILDVHQKRFGFCINRGIQNRIRSLENYGKALHFVRLSGWEGQSLVSEATIKYGLSFNQAAEMLSQIKVVMKYGSILDPITVKTLSGRSFMLNVLPGDFILDVKRFISDIEGIPIKQQKLLFNGKMLENHKTLKYYKIDCNSTIFLILELKGAADASKADDSMEWIFVSEEGEEEKEKVKKRENMEAGERGIICFRNKMGYVFDKCAFVPDGNKTEPFVIEMRMASKFNLL